MAHYTAISRLEYGSKTWRRFDNFRFFAGERTAPLVAAEFSKACVAFPITWLNTDGAYDPVALLGLRESENLFVDAKHRWVGMYTPAHFRTQPFRLIQTDEDQLTLGVREDLGLVLDSDKGNSFFNEEGELSDEMQPVVDMLKKFERNRAATKRASRALSEAGVLEPWDIAPTVNGEPHQLGGLYHVSQQALNNVDAETLHHLRDTGALAMAYCQQISQQLIQRLEMLHEQRAKSKVKQSMHPADRGGFVLGDDEGISFGGMAGNDDEG
jgi:hypothetical protein